jgi:hypothetical protein
MGDLLEVAWMGETALRHVGDDATAALLTSMAGHKLSPNDNPFDHPLRQVIGEHATALIEERRIEASVEPS